MAYALAERSVEDDLHCWQEAKNLRYTLDSEWQLVSDFVLPTHEFTSKSLTYNPRKARRYFSTEAITSCKEFAGQMHGMLMNPMTRWFALDIEDYDVSHDHAAQDWLFHCTTLMLLYLGSPASGFNQAQSQVMLHLGAFGTSVCETRTDPRTKLPKFIIRPLSSIWLTEDENGDIDGVYRLMEIAAKKLQVLLPDGKFSDTLQSQINDDKKKYEKVEILHCIYKRYNRDPSKRNAANMEWASRYIEVANKNLIHEGGFRRLPYIVTRWDKL